MQLATDKNDTTRTLHVSHIHTHTTGWGEEIERKQAQKAQIDMYETAMSISFQLTFLLISISDND